LWRLSLAGSAQGKDRLKMKRVRVITTAVPAALGLVIPAAAYMVTNHHPSHQVHPDTATKCVSTPTYYPHGFECLQVIGTSNFVNTMYALYWSEAGTAYVGYKDVAGEPADSKWRASPFVASSAAKDWWRHKWGPGCSFPTGTEVYAYANYNDTNRVKSKTTVHIKGSDFTGRKACAP
jgi:hypothetical protein